MFPSFNLGGNAIKILIAPDKFKGSMTAIEAANSIALGIKKVNPGAKLVKLPLSDGGEGLVDVMVNAAGGTVIETMVTGPLGNPVKAKWGLIEDKMKAVIEMSAASGLNLVSESKRNPSITSTYGTGELIKAAMDHGCNEIIVGIGGSATNDGGAGMARALGVKFNDFNKEPLAEGGSELIKLESLDLKEIDPRLERTKILVASDVDNPLIGPRGASIVYGPQKGASAEMAKNLDRALENYASVIKREIGINVDQLPGAGAAGGLGAGLIAFLGAELQPGIELVLDALNFDRHLEGCFLLVTGEGRLDGQSLHGKSPIGAARRAKKRNVPVLALAGSISGSRESFHREGITACFAIADGPLSLEESVARGPELLSKKAAEVMRLISRIS